jgi:acid phosphatase type 7
MSNYTSNQNSNRACVVALGGLATLLSGFLSGCAGTSSNLNSPSLQTPGLTGNNTFNHSQATGAFASLKPLESVKTPEGVFFTLPYLNLGNAPKRSKSESLTLLWHTQIETQTATEKEKKEEKSEPIVWKVEVKPATSTLWKPVVGKIITSTVAVEGVEPHLVQKTVLSGLRPGESFDYRILKNTIPVFAARSKAPSSKNTYKFAVFGDVGADTPEEKKIAFQISQANPDFAFITGDIVYDKGRASQYRTNFFPVYNNETPDINKGAPLLRSVPFIAVPGNHDLLDRDLDKLPDAMAYFYYWANPLNGPNLTAGEPFTPTLSGNGTRQQAVLTAAGENYPRMASFGFDWGNAHWTVLDANTYVDWSDPSLRAWVENDLKAAQKSTWRFVALHQPPFNSAEEHHDYQRLRVLSDLFEKYKVSIVWGGHVHNYQRTYPMTFVAKKQPDGKFYDEKNRVAGDWQLDKTFDGTKNTRPKGVLYVITGAAGAGLYATKQHEKPDTWEPFTAKFVADKHSFTSVDVQGSTLRVRQIDDEGKERDAFTITK